MDSYNCDCCDCNVMYRICDYEKEVLVLVKDNKNIIIKQSDKIYSVAI